MNTEGKVEFVTENVTQFIKYNKDEVLGKSIYNILHHGDHARFSACLLPMWSALEGGGGGSNSTVATTGLGPSAPPRNRTFNCRFLVKPPDDNEQTTMEEKQQRVSKYENMQVSYFCFCEGEFEIIMLCNYNQVQVIIIVEKI